MPHAMYQGVRRELAQLLADFWSRFYDLHGNTLASHSLAGPLARFPASKLLVSEPLWVGRVPGETFLSVRKVRWRFADLSVSQLSSTFQASSRSVVLPSPV